jgi:hypothetical protein
MADLNPDYILLGTIIGISTFLMIILTVLAVLRHREKQTPMTRTLLVMYALFILGNGAGLVSAIFGIFNIPSIMFGSNVSTLSGDQLVMALIHTFFAQIELLFFLEAFYFMFVFAQLVFGSDADGLDQIRGKLIKILIGTAIVLQSLASILLGYSMVLAILGSPVNEVLIWLGATILPIVVLIIQMPFVLLTVIPILTETTRARHRISKDDPHRSNFLYLGIMAFILLLTPIFTVLIIALSVSGVPYPNFAVYLTIVVQPVNIYAGYRGFFAVKSPKP